MIFRSLFCASRSASPRVLSLIFFLVAMSGNMTDPIKAEDQNSGTKFQWSKCLPISNTDKSIGILGGTEARSLVTMDNKLYAGIGYWMDTQEANPKLPGAQILRLDAPNGEWKVDLQLDEFLKGKRSTTRRYMAIAVMKSVQFQSDLNAHKLEKPVNFLLAGTWDKLGQLEVFAKQAAHDKWTSAKLGEQSGRYAEIRNFGSHVDKITGVQRVFAGTRVNGIAVEPQIYSGVYNPASPGQITWDKTPERWLGDLANLARTTKNSARITGFAECNGRLYATVYNVLYERQDGPKPSWKPVWRYDPEIPFGNGASGFRGLTAIDNPSGKGQSLMVAVEHNPSQLFRFDCESKTPYLELNISDYLSRTLGTKVGFADAGYNDMLLYKTKTGSTCLLLGMEMAAPQLPGNFCGFNPDAMYLTRMPDGKFYCAEIVDKSLKTKPALVAVRSMVNSPFKQDPPGTVYASGFDANRNKVHNTAWIYRGVPF